jgi:hypothetical protein
LSSPGRIAAENEWVEKKRTIPGERIGQRLTRADCRIARDGKWREKKEKRNGEKFPRISMRRFHVVKPQQKLEPD